MSKNLNYQEAGKNGETASIITILLVDEDLKIGVALQEFFRDFFTAKGYRMLHANTLSDALMYLKNEEIDLIITDLRLSQYSGLSLVIRSRFMPDKVPIIVMSAYTDLMPEEDWKLLGATEFVSKPPDLNRLRAAISKALARKSEIMQSESIKKTVAPGAPNKIS